MSEICYECSEPASIFFCQKCYDDTGDVLNDHEQYREKTKKSLLEIREILNDFNFGTPDRDIWNIKSIVDTALGE